MNSLSSNSRRRVLFVIGSMGGGGAERQVLEILKRLDRSRFQPSLYLVMKQGELLPEVPADVPIFAYWDGEPEKWYVRILRYIKLTRVLRYIHLARVLHLQQIDVIYDRTYLATLDAAGGCWLRPTPRISCCVADPGPELEQYARFSVGFSRWFARRAYLSASIVLANSEGLRRRVLEYFQLSPDHVQVFYNLLPDARSAIEVDGTQALGSVNESPFMIVTAGRLHPQKGYQFLLEAVDELVHRRGRVLKLVIFGNGPSEAELREFILRHELETSVTLGGFVAEPRHWYEKANLFVLPSLCEGMPNALIEAVASGIPALASDCTSGPREILDGGRWGGLVPPGDSKSLADGIADAMDHQAEWKARAESGRERVRQMFDPTIGIHRLEELFEQIAGRQSVSRAPQS